MPNKMTGETLNISEQRKRELKQLFPGVFTETTDAKGEVVETIDFEKLKAELGSFSDVYEGRRERYGMEWPGKRDCMKLIQQPSRATLKPCREESVDFDTTQNLFIEGDNLEVLKLLQKSYYGKVKMIYIDPPYNTGKEFIYPDNYKESLETYMAYAGLVDDEGKKFATNTATEGRFHTNWLNMMYPRLYLARGLLHEEGVVLVAIDDSEFPRLREMMDSVFGEENFIGTIVWNGGRKNDAKRLSAGHDYMLVYVKNDALLKEKEVKWRERKLGLDEVYAKAEELRHAHSSNYQSASENLKKWFESLPEGSLAKEHSHYKFIDENGVYYGDNISSPNYRKNLIFDWKGYNPPANGWRYNIEAMAKLDKEGLLIYPESKEKRIQYKRYLHNTEEWAPSSYIYKDRRAASKTLTKLMGGDVFDFPKDTDVIGRFIKTLTKESDIVIDFFSGSGTTGHSVWNSNIEECTRRKFILVQLPEKLDEKNKKHEAAIKLCDDLGRPRTIAELTKERLLRAGNVIRQQREGQLDLEGKGDLDLGFKVLKLDQSNFRQWQTPNGELSTEQLSQQLDLHTDHIDPYATQEEILYELLLKAGFMPTEQVETLDVAGKQVFSVAGGALLICLEEELTAELIDAVAEREPMQFICLDKGFKGNDQLKANAVQTFKSRSQNAETEMVFKVV